MRKHWIDNLRWVTVLLVLLYHVIYFYNNKGVFGGIGGFGPYPEYPQKHSFMPEREHFCILIISAYYEISKLKRKLLFAVILSKFKPFSGKTVEN